jgi:hypothetical protein
MEPRALKGIRVRRVQQELLDNKEIKVDKEIKGPKETKDKKV